MTSTQCTSIVTRRYRVNEFPFVKTPQCWIYFGEAINGSFSQNVVVKVTKDKDIIKESQILNYLTQNGLHFNSFNYFMVNYVDFFQDNVGYHLVMEYGGTSLFKYINENHKRLRAESESKSINLYLTEWHSNCKHIFKQMVTFIDILHNKLSVCHFDISPENVLINVNQQNNIKFCDFGYSEMFIKQSTLSTNKSTHFLCNKLCGKASYMSPEICSKKANFNAAASDTWSLGICLFVLLFGNFPFKKASPTDISFTYIESGRIDQVIEQWNKITCLPPMRRIFFIMLGLTSSFAVGSRLSIFIRLLASTLDRLLKMLIWHSYGW